MDKCPYCYSEVNAVTHDRIQFKCGTITDLAHSVKSQSTTCTQAELKRYRERYSSLEAFAGEAILTIAIDDRDKDNTYVGILKFVLNPVAPHRQGPFMLPTHIMKKLEKVLGEILKYAQEAIQ